MSAAARPDRTRAARESRPLFIATTVAAALLAAAFTALPSPAAHAAAAGEALVVSGPAGARRIALLDCDSGLMRAQTALSATLSAPVAADFESGAVYAATAGGELLRYSLPQMHLQARATIGFAASALAVGSGPDAIVLAGGRAPQPLSAHDPRTLAPLQRYPAGEGAARVSAILDLPGRQRLVVAFADLPELWEIAYARDAPPVLRGLVHDYRMNEAVPLPGRLTARPFRVANGTRTLLAGPTDFEVLRIDADGAAGVVNLDVRREIERPALPAVDPRGTVAWRADGARGWLIAAVDRQVLTLSPPQWRVQPLAAAGGPDALAAARDRLAQLEALAVGPAAAAQVVPGSVRGCEAVLDRDGHWLGRLRTDR